MMSLIKKELLQGLLLLPVSFSLHVKEELLSEFFVCNDLGRDEMFYARVKRSLNKLHREGYVGVC